MEQNDMPSSTASSTWSQDDETSDDDYFNLFPYGYRFVPTDYELVVCYLMKKVNNEPLPPNKIPEVNLYKKDTTDLIAEFEPMTETEWYFFTPRDKKYPNGSRPNRATPNGYWKPTGTDAAIPHRSQDPIGYKKTLDFYQGKHPFGTKTDWKMHEYIVNTNMSQNNNRPEGDMTLDEWVLCKIYKKKEKNGGDGASTSGSQPPAPTVNVAQTNEASLMAGNNINVEFEDQNQNSNASQPTTVYVSQNRVGGKRNKFEGQILNASQPTVNVAQNNEASLMAGNNNVEFEDQNSNASQHPTIVYVPQYREAPSVARKKSKNNKFEGQIFNASQPTVNVAPNNEASLMAGNSNYEFEDQNSNASQQPTPNQGAMHEGRGTFESLFECSQPNDQFEDDFWDELTPCLRSKLSNLIGFF